MTVHEACDLVEDVLASDDAGAWSLLPADPRYLVTAAGLATQVLASSVDVPDALEIARAAVEHASQSGLSSLEGRARSLLATVLDNRGQDEAALEEAEVVASSYDNSGDFMGRFIAQVQVSGLSARAFASGNVMTSETEVSFDMATEIPPRLDAHGVRRIWSVIS